MTQISTADLLRREQARQQPVTNEKPAAASFLKTAGAAISDEWSLASIARSLTTPRHEADPNFNIADPAVYDQLTSGLLPEYGEMIGQAVSMEHAISLRNRALKMQESEAALASRGWQGVALRFAAAATDPVAIGLGVATGGAGWVARGATRASRFARAGVLGAATNVPVDATLVANDPTLENDTILFGAAAGFFLGGLGGLIPARDVARAEATLQNARTTRERLAQSSTAMGAADPRQFTPEGRAMDAETRRAALVQMHRAMGMDESEMLPFVDEIMGRAPEEIDAILLGRGSTPVPPRAAETADAGGGDGITVTGQRPSDGGEPPAPVPPPPRATDFRPMNGTDAAAWGARIDLAGATGKVKSSPYRFVGSLLTFDPLLRTRPDGTKGPLTDAASAWLDRTVESMSARFAPAVKKPMEAFLRTQGFSGLRRSEGQRVFSRNVVRAVRNDAVYKNSLPEVQQAADALRAMSRETLELQRRHGVPGSIETPDDPNYLKRVWNGAVINRWTAMAGRESVVDFMAEAVMQGRIAKELDLNINMSRRVASEIIDRAIGKKKSNRTEIGGIVDLDSVDTVRDILTSTVPGISEEQVKQTIYRLLPDKQKGSVPGTFRNRVLLDETFEGYLEGVSPSAGQVTSLDDAFVNDIDTLMSMMVRDAAGLSAESVVLREAGAYYTRSTGVETAFPTWASLRQRLAREDSVEDVDLRRLDIAWRHIRGVPHPGSEWVQDFPAAGALTRAIKSFNYITTQGGFVLAALNEIARVPALYGMKATLQQLPAVANVFGRAKDGTYIDSVVRDLVGMGVIMDHRYSHQIAARADLDELSFSAVGSRLDSADRTLRGAAAAVSRYTGLDKMDQVGRNFAARAMVQMLVNRSRSWKEAVDRAVAAGASRSEAEASVLDGLGGSDLRFLGLSDRDARDLFRNLVSEKSLVKIDAGGRFDAFAVDLDKMPDDLSAKFVQAVALSAANAIQLRDIGSLPKWLTTNPLLRMVFQFRSFAIGAWPRQTLRFAQTIDERSAWLTLMYGTLIGGLTYIGRTHLEALGMDGEDREKFIEKRLSLNEILAVGLANNGVSSLVPMVTDNVLGPMGTTVFQNARHTGLGAYGFTQNPTFDLANNALASVGTLAEAAFDPDDRFTRGEFQQIRRMLPLQNALPFRPLLEAFRHNLPTEEFNDGPISAR